MPLTLTPKVAPYLVAQDARGLIPFIEKAIGGTLTPESLDSSGRLAHAEVTIADGLVMIGEKPSGRATFPAMIHVYVDDANAAFHRAVGAGASPVREPADSAEGQRRGGVRDSWGNEWWFSSPVAKH